MPSAQLTTQLTLASLTDGLGEELLTVEADRASNRCTAACLDARVELRSAILNALAEGLGTRRVAAAFGVSREVVRALNRQALNSGELDHAKEELARDALDLARRTIDRIADEIDDMPRSSLPIVAGVMIDKAQLLSGGATARVERTSGESVADIEAYLRGLPVAQPVVEGGGAGQKGIGAGGALQGAAGGAVGELGVPGSGDSVSPVLRASREEGGA